MSEQELAEARRRELEALLPFMGGNSRFEAGVVEGLTCAARCLANHPLDEAAALIRDLLALATATAERNRQVIAKLDTPDSRVEIEQRLADIRSGKVKMVPMIDIVLELEEMTRQDRNGPPKEA